MGADDGKRKARAAVQAMFDRYKLLASRRPKGHTVSSLVRTSTGFEADKR